MSLVTLPLQPRDTFLIYSQIPLGLLCEIAGFGKGASCVNYTSLNALPLATQDISLLIRSLQSLLHRAYSFGLFLLGSFRTISRYTQPPPLQGVPGEQY